MELKNKCIELHLFILLRYNGFQRLVHMDQHISSQETYLLVKIPTMHSTALILIFSCSKYIN